MSGRGVSEVTTEATEEEEEEEAGRMHSKKQEPHKEMWGKSLIVSRWFVVSRPSRVFDNRRWQDSLARGIDKKCLRLFLEKRH